MKILIAEDEPVSRRLLEIVLTEWGHKLVSAVDGEEAVRLYGQGRFDAVITDWMMPKKDGLAVVREIREMRPRECPWVIMLTAKGFRSHFQEAIAAGVDDFLEKPLDRGLLRARLDVGNRVLRMREAVHALARLVPMCMHCKSIRNDDQKWESIEQFLTAQKGVDLSHGLCPCCYYKTSLKPEVDKHERPAEVSALAKEIDAILAAGGKPEDRIVALDRLLGV